MKRFLLLAVLCLLIALPAFAVDPAHNRWHLYGGVIEANCPSLGHCAWVVRNQAGNQFFRVDCWSSDASGCAYIGAGHWVVLDGYVLNDGLTSDSRNFLNTTSILVWNWTNDTWYAPPSP